MTSRRMRLRCGDWNAECEMFSRALFIGLLYDGMTSLSGCRTCCSNSKAKTQSGNNELNENVFAEISYCITMGIAQYELK